MNDFNSKLKSLCTPAQIYFYISMFSILVMMGQNSMQSNTYKIGTHSVKTPFTNIVLFLFKIIGVVIWTYLLKFLCDSGLIDIAWFLVLLPLIFMFVLIAAVMLLFVEHNKSVSQELRTFQSYAPEKTPTGKQPTGKQPTGKQQAPTGKQPAPQNTQ